MKDLALDLLEMARARRDEPVALSTALIALDRLAQARPGHPSAHYASGRILLMLGQHQLALGAFRTALSYAPRDADAHYYEGVAQFMLGHLWAAFDKLHAALAIAPEHFEARFDLAQLHSRRGDREAALNHFRQALALRPGDFPALKKILQTLHGLGYDDAAEDAHRHLREAWAQSEDPTVRAVRAYVMDQFWVGALKVLAVDSLAPQGEPAVLTSFPVSDREGLLFTVTLETSRELRDAGSHCVLALQDGNVHASTEHRFDAVPAYRHVKPLAISVIGRYAGIDEPAL